MSRPSWTHDELLAAVRGVPFVSPAFAADRLLYLTARLRAELAKAPTAELNRFVLPKVATSIYMSVNVDAAVRPRVSKVSSTQVERIEEALNHIVEVRPDWMPLVSIPLEFQLLRDEQVSSTNPLLPQTIYLGKRAFASQDVLREVLVHELSHVWCGMLCEIADFQRSGGPENLVLPSGTRGKNTRQVVFAATFAAAAVNYYGALGGAASTSRYASRMVYCLDYLRRTLVTLKQEATPNAMGHLITRSLEDFAGEFRDMQ